VVADCACRSVTVLPEIDDSGFGFLHLVLGQLPIQPTTVLLQNRYNVDALDHFLMTYQSISFRYYRVFYCNPCFSPLLLVDVFITESSLPGKNFV